jgi:hypothetical protein
MSHFHAGRGLTVLAALLIAGAAPAESVADPAETAPVDAVWKPQRLAFQYRGYSTFYSCGGLQEKLQHILLSMGARADMRISGYACDEQLGNARFEILFHSPVEATPENVRALTTYSAQDELLARTRGETLVSATDLPRFAAQWQEVSFAHDHRMRLEPRDCELVRAVRGQILAHMSVRIVHDRAQCSPGYGNSGPPRLTVVALVPMPTSASD